MSQTNNQTFRLLSSSGHLQYMIKQ